MTPQGFDFQVESACYVRAMIDFFSSPEPYFPDLVRLQAFFQEIGIGKMIPGIREYSIQRHLTGYAMITMPDIVAIGIGRHHRIGLILSEQTHQHFSKFRCVFQTLIRQAEKNNVTDTENFGSSLLLFFSNFSQNFRFHVDVRGPLIAIGTNNVHDTLALFHPSGHCSGHSKLGIIRMRRYHQYIGFICHTSSPVRFKHCQPSNEQ